MQLKYIQSYRSEMKVPVFRPFSIDIIMGFYSYNLIAIFYFLLKT